MFNTFRTLMSGANARAEDHVKDVFAIELIDQKIRDSDAQLRAAKATLASLIQRQRSENRLLGSLQGRIGTMLCRAEEAIEAGRKDLAQQAADAIAAMENEAQLRQGTVDRLEGKIIRLRGSVEAAHRRLIDLKQGAVTARAIRREQQVQGTLRSTIAKTSAADEAEELIARVVGREDPFEQSQILESIEADLSHEGLDARMEACGFGPTTKVTAEQVMDRLKRKTASSE